jgi:hypothetical protein
MNHNTKCEDCLTVDTSVTPLRKGHGKNFKPLIAAGAWEICGFTYGKSKCGCCGRPISRILKLKNTTHQAAVQRDLNYTFSEIIDIGVVCGPIVFMTSCIGFYNDPESEWKRTWAVWKSYCEFVMLCVQNADLWDNLPAEFKGEIDHYLEVGWKGEATTSKWMRVRDAKKKLLRTRRWKTNVTSDFSNRKVDKLSYYYNLRTLLQVVRTLSVVDSCWTVTKDSNGDSTVTLFNAKAS